ncbi:MAG TPA: hypothetical protein VK641_16285 [Terriglobales bacterium]|nr:hypothetical protein [Terriglobales bacterium]
MNFRPRLRNGFFLCFFLVLLTCLLPAQQAPPAAGESSSRHHPKLLKQPAAPAFDPGSISDGVYANPYFGFTYKLPFGWVDRSNAMQDDSPEAAKDPAKSVLLLAVFEQPPEAPREAINSGVVVAAESVSAYPGLKTAADYFGILAQLTTDKGFKQANDPAEVAVGGKTLIRGDFSKETGKATVHQTALVLLVKSYVVSFTVIGASEDEVNSLLENLSFAAKKPARPAPGR